MSEPRIAERTPIRVELQPGTYWWCRCGRSQTQPFCDGSHEGTDFEPLEFTLDRPKNLWLCRCKHTKKPPYCDNTHQTLFPAEAGAEPTEAVGDPEPESP